MADSRVLAACAAYMASFEKRIASRRRPG